MCGETDRDILPVIVSSFFSAVMLPKTTAISREKTIASQQCTNSWAARPQSSVCSATIAQPTVASNT